MNGSPVSFTSSQHTRNSMRYALVLVLSLGNDQGTDWTTDNALSIRLVPGECGRTGQCE